jgi:hypothetical protein
VQEVCRGGLRTGQQPQHDDADGAQQGEHGEQRREELDDLLGIHRAAVCQRRAAIGVQPILMS